MKCILFGNDGCSSCRQWKPVFEKLMREYNINWQYIDINDKVNKEKYLVSGIPVTIFLNDTNDEIGRILGNMDEDMARKQIEYYSNV